MALSCYSLLFVSQLLICCTMFPMFLWPAKGPCQIPALRIAENCPVLICCIAPKFVD